MPHAHFAQGCNSSLDISSAVYLTAVKGPMRRFIPLATPLSPCYTEQTVLRLLNHASPLHKNIPHSSSSFLLSLKTSWSPHFCSPYLITTMSQPSRSRHVTADFTSFVLRIFVLLTSSCMLSFCCALGTVSWQLSSVFLWCCC